MKLRITTNSIRIRIRKSELAQLEKENLVEESVQFPSGPLFKFALEIQEQNKEIKACLDDNYLALTISAKAADQWMNTPQVGIETQIELPNNENLLVLIEKDFPCLDREEEDKSDTFWELAPDSPDAC